MTMYTLHHRLPKICLATVILILQWNDTISFIPSKIKSFSDLSSLRSTMLTEPTDTRENTNSPTSVDDISNTKQSSSVGSTENSRFKCDDSVTFWREFQREKFDDAKTNLREAYRIASKYALSGNADAAAYWSSHLVRTGYFASNAFLGTVGHELHERLIVGKNSGNEENTYFATSLTAETVTRLVLEAILVYEQDWKSIESGEIKAPWDAAISNENGRLGVRTNHRQTNPLFVASETLKMVRESIGVLGRRNRKAEPSVWVDSRTSSAMGYPDYYLNDFHYQTDGWFSSKSANLYEVSTETLFLGRQDAMQRRTIIPLARMMDRPKNILDVACGTGRFATFVRDNFPEANMTLVEMSPFYLDKARENDSYWRKQRGKDVMKRVKKSEESPAAANFVQANAEALPFEDESFDAITCVYLFHELPSDARANVAAEMARVLAPGGVIILTDSCQKGDRPALEKRMSNFGRLNEPYYVEYTETDLPALFEKHGLECSEKFVASSSKTLSFSKPVKSNNWQ